MLVRKHVSTKHNQALELTSMIREIIDQSEIKDGFCIISIPHTTAGLVVTSFWDPLGWEDLMDELNKMIPSRIDFKHQESPTDASGHIKSALTGTSMVQIISDGKLMLGSSQGIYMLEFDGPREREFIVKIIAG